MLMPLCCVSFLVLSCGTSVLCNGHRNHGIVCVPYLESIATMSIGFDLLMFRGVIDTFAFVINYLA
jgi:hypothetical protein